MKQKTKNILGYVIIGAIVLYILITSVYDLLDQNNRYTLNITDAAEVLQVENSISGIIPTGTDYYYVGIEENTKDAYIIHAPKGWAEKNFSIEGNPNTVQITALAKRLKKFEIQQEIYRRVGTVEDLNFPLGVDKCLELSYVRDSFLRIGSFLFAIVLGIIGFIIYKKHIEVALWIKKVYCGCVIISMILMLISILRW